jgi:hypothetical protein
MSRGFAVAPENPKQIGTYKCESLMQGSYYEMINQDRNDYTGSRTVRTYVGKLNTILKADKFSWRLYQFDEANLACGIYNKYTFNERKTTEYDIIKTGTFKGERGDSIFTFDGIDYSLLRGGIISFNITDARSLASAPPSLSGTAAAPAENEFNRVSAAAAPAAAPVENEFNRVSAAAAPAATPAENDENEFNRVSAAAKQERTRNNKFNNGKPTRRKIEMTTNSKFYRNNAGNSWALSANGKYLSLKNGTVRNEISNPHPAFRRRHSTRRRSRHSRKGDRSRN